MSVIVCGTAEIAESYVLCLLWKFPICWLDRHIFFVVMDLRTVSFA